MATRKAKIIDSESVVLTAIKPVETTAVQVEAEPCFDVIVKRAFKHVINNQEIVGNVGDAATLTLTQLIRLKEYVNVNS